MTTRLSLYNEALLICGERSLSSLTENREPRHLLDQVWNDGGVRACLENGQWKFAMRSVQADYAPSITPAFGYRRAFDKPTDWVVTCAVCEDEYFNAPLTQYVDERAFWYADLDTIYVRYVSDGATYGGDLSLWPISFADYVAVHFASRIILKLTSDERKRDAILHPRSGLLAMRLKLAKNKDAMGGPVQFFPQGSWTRSRRAGAGSRSDRGSGGNLIG